MTEDKARLHWNVEITEQVVKYDVTSSSSWFTHSPASYTFIVSLVQTLPSFFFSGFLLFSPLSHLIQGILSLLTVRVTSPVTVFSIETAESCGRVAG